MILFNNIIMCNNTIIQVSKLMIEIKADFRAKTKTSESRRLRKQKKFPAIIYKNVQYPNVAISINHDEIQHPKIITHFYKNNIIKLITNRNTTFLVKIQDIQYHPFKSKIIHIDFLIV